MPACGRPALAYARSALAPTVLVPTVALPGALQYALAPELAPLLPLFNSQQLAVMLTVGTLVQPTTKAQYLARSVPLPPKLFSHNDQQSVWQSSAPEGATSGWGGTHLILGGRVNGRRFYGTAPVIANNGPDEVGQGHQSRRPKTVMQLYLVSVGLRLAESADLAPPWTKLNRGPR